MHRTGSTPGGRTRVGHGTRRSHAVGALLAACVLAVAAACGGGNDDSGGGGDGKEPLIFGTTDSFGTVDPAGAYDLPGWEILYNIGQTLVSIPPGETQPEPDAAKSCEFTDATTYECTLKKGLKFSDGSELTSADVKATFDRMIRIDDPNGPSSIFADQLDSTEAPDPRTVVFHLKFADATWPYRLTTGAATIVPDSYPSAKLQPMKAGKIIGSGPYKVAKYDPSQQIILEPNEHYTGDKKLANSKVLIQIYSDEASLKSAVESGEVQVAYRSLTPTLLADLKENGADKGVRVVKGNGTGISYIVFNTNKPPFDDVDVRRAVAALLDRDAIASNVYNGTVKPLYSMVPAGLDGHIDAFKKEFGTEPDVARARKLLERAGVEIPVKTQFWYNTEHYGEASADMYGEIKRQLESSGLFEISIKSTAWQQYQKDYAAGAYPAWQLGWYPDFPDPDNYLSPFYATENFIGNGYGYSSAKADRLLTKEKSTTDPVQREKLFTQIQRLGATDVPLIPIWQDTMIAAVREGVTGVQKTFDPLYTFRFWLVAPQG